MEFKNTKAIYIQIADYICEQVLLGKWSDKGRILSVREMAVSLQVNPNTVVRTYAFLEEKGVIAMQRGVGYFLAEEARKNILKLKREEFLQVDLPELFKSMDLLDIDLNEIEKIYNQRSSS